jgi:glucokinase
VIALAVDLGGSHAACAVVNAGSVLACERIEISHTHGLGAALPAIAKALHRAVRLVDLPLTTYAGVAFSFCGLVDPMRRRVTSTNAKYDDAPSIDMEAWARSEFGLPLRIDNDARLALLGERQAGAAAGFDDIVMVTLGTGVGGAAMMGGRLVRGRHYQAGCLGGHLLARYGGRECTCGALGCVEAEASTWALPAMCREHPAYEASPLAQLSKIDFAELVRHAGEGDSCASDIFARCVDVWSAGVVSLIHAYDPEVVVIGGGVMSAAGRILPAISDYVHRRAWTPWGQVQVRLAALGDTAALLGALPLLKDSSIE